MWAIVFDNWWLFILLYFSCLVVGHIILKKYSVSSFWSFMIFVMYNVILVFAFENRDLDLSSLFHLTWIESAVLWIFMIIFSVFIDIEHYLDREYIEDHKLRNALRIFIWYSVSVSVDSALINALIFLLTFSPLWGLVIHDNYFYLGTTATYDKILGKYPIVYKLFLLVCFSLLIYIVYEKITTGSSVVV